MFEKYVRPLREAGESIVVLNLGESRRGA
jgi:hypothetical protein